MRTLKTERLAIAELRLEDARFALELLNDPDFISQIADRGVRTLEQAHHYLRDGPLASYRDNGFGMFAVRLRSSGELLGMCGLVRREELQHVDIGYAFLPAGRGKGYALEAAREVMLFATRDLRLQRLAAIVAADNAPSRSLLEKLGLRYQKMIRLKADDHDICLYEWCADNAGPE